MHQAYNLPHSCVSTMEDIDLLCLQTHTLRLKRTYQRKSEEVRNLQQASEAIAGSPSGSTSGSTPIASGYISPTSHQQQSSLHLSPEAGSSGSRSGSRPTSRSGLDGNFEAGSSGHRSTGKGDILISGASEQICLLHGIHEIVLTGCLSPSSSIHPVKRRPFTTSARFQCPIRYQEQSISAQLPHPKALFHFFPPFLRRQLKALLPPHPIPTLKSQKRSRRM